MAVESVKLPDIGEGVTEGELVKWLVKPGDAVSADQPVAEVMTDKATVEVPSPIAGKVVELKAKEGDIIPIETAILTLETSGEAKAAAPTPKPAATPAPAAPQAPSAPVASPAPPMSAAPAAGSGGVEIYPPAADVRVLATPATRRLAREMQVDVNQIKGTGLAGRVTREDVMKAKGSGAGAVAAGQPSVGALAPSIPRPAYQGPQGAAEERVALRGIRRKIAEQMQLTKQIVPHFTLMDEANVTELVNVRNQVKSAAEPQGVKVTYLPFVMKALMATLREFPMFNASIDDQAQEIVYKKYFNIGFAADTPNGLLVPVVKNADQKTILQLSREITELSKKARDGKLSLDEMKGATITITNIGSVGGTYATPIINHPEVAILGMYKIQERPVFVNGQVAAASVMNYTITCDHRLIDGAVAANFLKAFLRRVESPSHLLLDMI